MNTERILIGDDDPQHLFEHLESDDVYPHKPESVEHIQTHISHVYIAPPFVYKLKKPVDFGFVNYKTLQKRKHFCEREVDLNRRLCSDIYLGVVPVTDASGKVVEYAVKMKKLDEQYFLDSYIGKNALTYQLLDRVTDVLIGFYGNQNPGEEILKYGKIESIKYNTDENFQQTESFVGETLTKETYNAIRYFNDRYFVLKHALFNRRIEEKRIVDGHGDLHLEHIHVTPDRVCIYDCIEFNDRFRYGDLAADLAFLVMDLDFRNLWKEGRYFIQQVSQKLNDPDIPQILDFYKCYRAYVKGKVKSIQSAEQEVSEEDRKKARNKAVSYFNLSLRYALTGSRPVMLIFMGRIATGKSSLSEDLEKTLNIKRFSSDKTRKDLAGIPLQIRVSEPEREELYSPEMSEKTNRRLSEEANKQLKEGKSVIVDATFSRRAFRTEWIKNLEKKGIDYLFIEVQASDEIIKSRLAERENVEELITSDARLEDFEKLKVRYQPPDELPESSIIRINTETDFKATLESLYKKMIDWRLVE